MAASVEPVSPEPPPFDRRAVLRQYWAELAYLHWPYEPAVVQRLLPAGVTVDTFDGRAWIGLIPFEMRNVRLGPTPPLPWVSQFIEVNVRTYVTDAHGRRAVWFFSLDVPRTVVVAVARTAFALPYCWARCHHEHRGERHRYRLTRRWPRAGAGAGADLAFTVDRALDPREVSDLDHFLTARWALLTRRGRRVQRGVVDHPRWPLWSVDDVEVGQDLIEAAGLPAPVGSPHVRYSPGVEVQVAWFDALPPVGGG